MLSAGGRTVQRNISIHFMPHCQPGNRVPEPLTAPIRHVDNLFSVDHKVPDVKTGYHCIFAISLRVCDSEDSAACIKRAKERDLKARSSDSSNTDNCKIIR